MAQKANAHRRDLQLEVGEKVLIRLQPHRQISPSHQAPLKLSKRFYGPFTILERIGLVAYKLDLPLESSIHNVFHVYVLKPFQGNFPVEVCPLPCDSVNKKPLSVLVAICANCTVLQQGRVRPQVLMQ